jgi:hypothetical protein
MMMMVMMMMMMMMIQGHKSRSFTVREEHRLRVSEKKVMRIFAHKREKVIGRWTYLDNQKLHSSFSSQNIIRAINSRRIKWVRHGEIRNAHRTPDGKSAGRRLLWKQRHIKEYDIKMDIKEFGCEDVG